MLSVLTWKWKSDANARLQYTAEHVNIFSAMLKRNLTLPYKLYCITDDNRGLDKDIIYYPLWKEPNIKLNSKKPNCYRRLKIYSWWAKDVFGERILSIDIDCVIVANIDSLLTRTEDFVAWNKRGVPYQGGMVLHTPGTRAFLWDEFKFPESRQLGIKKGYCGSDQAWVSARLPAGEAVWTPADGVLSYKSHVRNRGLPSHAKIIFYHGNPKPWQTNDDFLKEHWRL